MEDSQIISLSWDRDPRAIEETRCKYGNYCYQVAQNILGCPEDAEECVSDTWLNAWNAIPPRKPGHLRLFLARITRNLSFNRYRLCNTEKRGGGQLPLVLDELDECLAGQEDVEGTVAARELGRCINAFLSSLPSREAAVFLRRYFYAESAEEIGHRFHLSPGNIAVILSRTRKKLRKHLVKEGYLHE